MPQSLRRSYERTTWSSLVALALLSAPGALLAQHSHDAHQASGSEILIFPKIDLWSTSDLDTQSPPYERESEAAVDLFATADVKHVRLLGEFFVSKTEHELERGQIGWQFGETTFWFGRFHNPIGYHNPQFHHGAFLQTTIDRPGIVAFEDDGGVLPMHIMGFLVEGSHLFGHLEFAYSFAAGQGPELSDKGLEPFDLLDPSAGAHEPAFTARVSFRSTRRNAPELGVFVNRSDILADRLDVHEVEQQNAGIYGVWEGAHWRVVSELFDVRNDVIYPDGTTGNGDFAHGYAQAEYLLTDKWSLYSRIERTADVDNAYLRLMPGFVPKRELVGAQYRIGKKHVLKFETSEGHASGDDFRTGSFSWSAAFP
jgi:hypothetical protein